MRLAGRLRQARRVMGAESRRIGPPPPSTAAASSTATATAPIGR